MENQYPFWDALMFQTGKHVMLPVTDLSAIEGRCWVTLEGNKEHLKAVLPVFTSLVRSELNPKLVFFLHHHSLREPMRVCNVLLGVEIDGKPSLHLTFLVPRRLHYGFEDLAPVTPGV